MPGVVASKVRRMINSHKLKKWQKELTAASESSGISFEEVCDYLGLSYNRDLGFYVKLPKRRRTIIGIGMALKQPLDVINRWITYYGMKRRLYSKDITEDLIWIYLINRNINDAFSGTNYFDLYEECLQVAFETYLAIWNSIIKSSADTSDVDRQIAEISSSNEIEDLKQFVINNIDSFKTAYTKPRKMLSEYLQCILTINGKNEDGEKDSSLISLRGWLDDSMINYLSGSTSTINVTDRKTGERVPAIKQVPKSRKAHISLAMALGMTVEEIDRYLELMGYMPLSEEDPKDRTLILALEKWEDEHPLQRALKDKYIDGDEHIEMDHEDELQAVSDMLMLRQELKEQYRRKKLKFDYLKS